MYVISFNIITLYDTEVYFIEQYIPLMSEIYHGSLSKEETEGILRTTTPLGYEQPEMNFLSRCADPTLRCPQVTSG